MEVRRSGCSDRPVLYHDIELGQFERRIAALSKTSDTEDRWLYNPRTRDLLDIGCNESWKRVALSQAARELDFFATRGDKLVDYHIHISAEYSDRYLQSVGVRPEELSPSYRETPSTSDYDSLFRFQEWGRKRGYRVEGKIAHHGGITTYRIDDPNRLSFSDTGRLRLGLWESSRVRRRYECIRAELLRPFGVSYSVYRLR